MRRGGYSGRQRLALALVAVAFEEDLSDVADCGRLRAFGGADFDFDVGEAGDGAAIDANEMGVLAGGVFAGDRFGFKAPGVVAGVEAGEEAGVGEFDEAAVESRFVVALGHQGVGDVGVADGLSGGGNVLQHGHAGGRSAEASSPDTLPGVFNGDGDRFWKHLIIIAASRSLFVLR